MHALTNTEAARRAELISVRRYHIALDLTGGPKTFLSTTTVEFRARAGGSFIELACDELLEATLDGVALELSAFADNRLPLPDLDGEHRLVVRAQMSYSLDGEGIHRFTDPADGAVYLCATSAVDNAKRWFACFDQPDLKASIEMTINCPTEWSVYGNGSSSRTASGRWQLAPTVAISTYLMAFVAGPWHSRWSEHDGISLALHARQALREELDRDAADLFDLTARSLAAFHELFGVRYPFGHYHQAFVPEFNWGAMENPGCVTFRDQLLFRSTPSQSELVGRTTTVVHEMAHMWFGNLVTMRWWDDLWLNESFAEYLGHLVTEKITDLPVWQDFAAARKSWGYDADRRASTHPVAGNGAVDARAALDDFDGISYAKGASVLRQLAAYLGEEMFLDGLRAHIRSHAYANATFADLLNSWAECAGADTPSSADLTRWTQVWLRQPGVDVIAVELPSDGIRLVRHPPVYGPPAHRPHTFAVAAVPGPFAQQVSLDADSVTVALAGVGADQIVLPNSGDETWATVRLAPEHWQRLPSVLAQPLDAAARVVLWNALRTAVADGLVSPELAVATVAAGIPHDSEVVLTRLLGWITDAIAVYLAPGARREHARSTLAAATRALLDDAEPASGLQLTAAQAWVRLTDEVSTLRRWTAQTPEIAGLLIGPELRWAALEQRARLGDLTEVDIDSAYAADESASGQVHAARCRALRPDTAAKDAAWRELLDPHSTLSQYQLTALASGIWVAGQEELTRDYAQRWFTELPPTSDFRTGKSLTVIAGACFPRLAVEAPIVAAAEALAARTDVPSGLRRLAGDAADDLRRALHVRSLA